MKRLYRINYCPLPEQLVTLGYSPSYIDKHCWKYDYFITALLDGYCHSIQNKDGYYQIDTDTLKKVLKQLQVKGQRGRAYSRIRADLKALGIINYYSYFDAGQGKRVCWYTIKDQYLERGWTSVRPAYFQPTVKLLAPEYRIPYRYIKDVMQRITIDEQEARTFISQALHQKMVLKPKKVKYKICFRVMDAKTYSRWMQVIDNIVDGNYFFHADDQGTGRVYNTITSFPKLLRPFLRLNGQSLIEVDVSNCQPLVFVLMLRQWALARGIANAPDILQYEQLCSAGGFYDYLIDLMEANGEEIKASSFKVDFFTRVFFSTEKKRYKWRTIFEQQFPTVSACISSLKASGHNQVAIQLQRREADIVVRDAYQRLYQAGIIDIFPIHDAILTTATNQSVVESALVESFQIAGLQATIKIK